MAIDDDDKVSLTLLNLKPDGLKAAADNLERLGDDYHRVSIALAKMRKRSYDAHMAEGFEASQALYLCNKFIIE